MKELSQLKDETLFFYGEELWVKIEDLFEDDKYTGTTHCRQITTNGKYRPSQDVDKFNGYCNVVPLNVPKSN